MRENDGSKKYIFKNAKKNYKNTIFQTEKNNKKNLLRYM